MRRLLATALLLFLVSVSAQPTPEPSPQIAVLVHHPNPDAADPLGVSWGGTDTYYGRYHHLDADRDGFDFPHTVFDGVVAIEGLPDGSAPYVSTRDAYHTAFADRAAVESPMALELSAITDGDALDVRVAALPFAERDLAGARIWIAVVEDPVDYAPPPALSNGVTIHPFVVRTLDSMPHADGLQTLRIPVTDAAAPNDWNPDHLWVAAWVQNGGAPAGGFDAHEVLQSAFAPVDGGAVRATERTVLLEMYSATWCDTCLFGDRVAEEMAEEFGIHRVEPTADRTRYWTGDGPVVLWFALALIGGIALAMVRLPGGRP